MPKMVNDLLFEMKGGKKGVVDKDKTKQRIKKRSTDKDETKRKMFATKKGVAVKDKTKQRIKKRSTNKDETKRMFAKKTSIKPKVQQKGKINDKSDLYKQGNNNLNQTVIIVIRKRISV